MADRNLVTIPYFRPLALDVAARAIQQDAERVTLAVRRKLEYFWCALEPHRFAFPNSAFEWDLREREIIEAARFFPSVVDVAAILKQEETVVSEKADHDSRASAVG